MAEEALIPLERPMDFEFRCPADVQVLPLVRMLVTGAARQLGFSDEEIDCIEMAVDEACANVVRHAYKHLGVSCDLPEQDRCSNPETLSNCVLRIRVHLDHGQLKVCVIDQGVGIKNQPLGVDSVEQFARKGGDGGLGIYIIRRFMDIVEYDCPPESGTVLTMIKRVGSTTTAAHS